MGNSSSSELNKPKGCGNKNQYGGKKLYKMMKSQPALTEENTINFHRSDIQNTLSDRSIIEVIHQEGLRVNAPSRDRYSGLETQRIKNKNSNIIGGNNTSSVSIDELSAIKNLLVLNGGSCGCGENTVLNQNGGYDSATSSFMPQTMMDLSATSVTAELNGDSATSSFMPQTMMDLSATSVTAELNGGSATSSFMPQTMMDLSATSVTAELNGGSVTSSFMPQTMQLSATSETSRTVVNSVNSAVNSAESAMNRLSKIANLQFGGVDESELNIRDNSTSELINALSLSSDSNRNAINYSNIIGGTWNKQKGGESINEDDINESSSSTESTTESVKETLKRLSTASSSSKSTRSKKASSTSSDGTSDSSLSITSSCSSSSLNSTSSSSSITSRKSSPYSANIASVSGGNIYLNTESMSGGNFIDAKQFYSSEQGDLYSSDTNYLRHNINKRRFK
jgi:hypothetical protein